MNKIYRVIWNSAKGAWQAASEMGTRKSKEKSRVSAAENVTVGTKSDRRSRRAGSALALEPRMLFDAAGAVTAVEAVDAMPVVDLVVAKQGYDTQLAEALAGGHDAGTDESGVIGAPAVRAANDGDMAVDEATPSAALERTEIVFIDGALEDYQTLVDAVGDGSEVVLLDASGDGVEQIAAYLEGRTGIDAVHILSHGDQGELRLGTARVNSATMGAEYGDELTAIGSALSDDGDILTYGCDFTGGDKGVEAAKMLARLTGADVAGSSDATGDALQGGDWELETQVGTIDSAFLAIDSYDGLLAPAAFASTPADQVIAEGGALDFSGLALEVSGGDADMVAEVDIISGSGGLSRNGGTAFAGQSATGDLAAINAFLDQLEYVPDPESNDTAIIRIRVDSNSGETSDSDGDWEAVHTFEVSITPVADAPNLTGDATLAPVAEDSTDPAGDTVANLFGALFEDSDSSDQLAGIAISADASTAGQGSWQYQTSGSPTWNNIGAVSRSSALLLAGDTRIRFLPAANFNGAVGSLTVHAVDDSGSRAFGTYVDVDSGDPDLDSSGNTLGTSITAVNDPFTVEIDTGLSLTEGGSEVINQSELNITDPDLTPSQITYTVVGSVPEGQLLVNGVSATTFTQADINNNLVVYQHSGVESAGALTLQYTVSGPGNADLTGRTLAITVADGNSAPSVTVPGAQSVAEDGSLVLTGGSAPSVSDPDAGSNAVQVTVSASNGSITLSSLSGLVVTAGSNGSATVTVQGSLADINSALDGLQYTPDADFYGSDSIILSIDDLGNSGAGGALSDSDTIAVTVNPVDDAPVTGGGTLAPVSEDTLDPAGATVGSLLTAFSDVDGDTLAGIAISADSGSGADGTWEFSVDDGITWSGVGTVSTSAALLLDSGAKLRFVPSAEFSGPVGALTVHAIDNSGSRTFTTSVATRLTADVNSGATDIDANGAPLDTSVTEVNDLFEVVTDKVANVSEGGNVTIDDGVLEIIDVEASPSQIIYTLTAGTDLSEGTLELNGAAISVGDTFTQADLNAGNLVYIHNGDETGGSQTLAYDVTDGDTTESRTLAINVSSVNDVPVFAVPGEQDSGGNPLTAGVERGGSLAFSAANIEVVDPDNTADQIRFQVSSLPSAGELTLNGAPVGAGTTFFLSQLSDLVYTHDGGSASADSFQLVVRDGAGGVAGPKTVNIAIDPVNSAPLIAGSMTLDEGEQGKVVSLNISDAETAAANLTVTILTLPDPAEAVLYFNGAEITQGMVDGGFSFSADQQNLLTINHISADQETPPDVSFDVRVTDEAVSGSPALSTDTTVTVAVQPVNDDPVGTSGDITLDEGEVFTLTTAQLNASDVDTPVENLTFRVEVVPEHGLLFFDDGTDFIPMGAGATFSLTDVTNGYIKFQHDGSSLDADSLEVTLRDGEGGVHDGGTVVNLVVNITVNDTGDSGPDGTPDDGPIGGGGPVGGDGTPGGTDPGTGNDPVVANDEQFYTPEDTPLYVSEAVLLGNDTGDTPLHIVSVQGAVNGTVELIADGDPGDLNPGDGYATIRFTPDANFGGFAEFTYTVDDATPDTDSATGRVVVLVQNDPPMLSTGTQGGFDEGALVTLNSDAMAASDVDNDPAQLTYRLTSLPAAGVLYFDSTPGDGIGDARDLRLNGTFTQADLDAGRIKFQHDGSENHTTTFNVELTDASGDTVNGTVTLQAAPVNDQPVIAVEEVVVDEGASIIIDNSYIATSDVDAGDVLTLRIDSAGDLPSHGTLELDSDNNGTFETVVVAGTTFTQAQVNNGQLRYTHDGSENFNDSFRVTVQDDSGAANDTATAVVDVGIISLNDDPVSEADDGFVTNEGTALYEGQHKVITTAVLSAGDPDNTANQRQFRIDSNVQYGDLLRNGQVLGVGSTFTQQDLEDGLISYRHDGSEHFEDSFDFTISDAGGGSEPSGTFEIDVLPINDAPTITAPAERIAVEEQTVYVTGITIADPDSVDGSGVIDESFGPLRVELVAANGSLGATAVGGAVVTGTGSSTLVVEGNLGDINATLDSLTYTGNVDFTGSDAIAITVRDQGNTGTDPDLTGPGEALDGLTFDPVLTDDGDSNTTYEQATASIAITVQPVNDPIVNTVPGAQTVDEDTDLVFSTAGGNRLAVFDVDQGAGYEAEVTLTVLHGTLSASAGGSVVLSGNNSSELVITGSQADINATLEGLVYRGASNYHGADTLTMVSRDQGNTGLGGEKTDTDTVAITVSPVNDNPVTVDIAASGNEDGTITFSLDSSTVDGGSDSVTDAVVTNYRVETLPANGTLRDSGGNVITAGDVISVAEATGMTFTPDADFNNSQGGAPTFTFTAIDEAGAEGNTATATLNVIAVNDAPVIGGLGDTVNYTEGSGSGAEGTYVRLDANGDASLVSDIELIAQHEDNFDSSRLDIARQGGANGDDRFSLDTSYNGDGQTVALSGSDVLFNSVVVGTIASDSTGATGSAGLYRIVFNADADQNAVSAVMKRVSFASVDDDPSSSVTIEFTFYDGNTGAQGSGGDLSGSGLATVTVTNINDAPSFDDGATLTVQEDLSGAGDSDGQTVAALLAAEFSDPDPSGSGADFAGIAIVGNNSAATQGTWQYSVNGGISWVDVGTVAENDALLLDTTALLRFVPDADANNTTFPATPQLDVLALDDSGARTFTSVGSESRIDASSRDGSSDLSADSVAVSASVLPVNDTPVLGDLDGDSTTFTEGISDAQGTAIVLDQGTLASLASEIELLANSEDNFDGATLIVRDQAGADPDDFYFVRSGVNGIGISGADTTTSGQRIFNDGSVITYLGTAVATIVDNSVGTDGGGDTGILHIRFNANATGAAVNAVLRNLSFNSDNQALPDGVVKQVEVIFNDGNADANAGAQGSGGAGVATAVVNITLQATNDAPSLSGGATLTTSEDGSPAGESTLDALLGANFSDPDGTSSFAGVALTGYDEAGLGTWQIDVGSGWEDLATFDTNAGGLSASNALLLNASTLVRFVPALDANTSGNTRPTLTVHGAETDELSGGPTALAFTTSSASPETYNTADDPTANDLEALVAASSVTIDVVINAVNDAPTATDTAADIITSEDSSAAAGTAEEYLLSGDPNIADVDPATTGVLDDNTFGGGVITVSLDSGVNGDQLLVNGALAGIASVSGGTNGADLIINLAPDATFSEVDAILQDLRYQHTTDIPPTAPRDFTITVNDQKNIDGDGDNAGSGAAASVTLTGSITINEQNDPPLGSDNTVITDEDTSYTFVEADFGYSQPGDESDAFAAVRIDSLPGNGVLWLDGDDSGTRNGSGSEDVSVNDLIALADITSGRLRFTPDAELNGAPLTTFTFSVQDERGGFDISPRTMEIDITAVNDAPVLTGTALNPTATEQGAAGDAGSSTNEVQLVSGVTLNDIDLADNGGIGFDGASITVEFSDGYQSGDRLFVNGSPAGIDSTSGGNGTALTINLANGTSAAQVEAIIEAIRFRHDGDDPTGGGTDTTRNYSVTFNDGGTRGTPGGLDSNALTGTITLTPVNDTPIVVAPGAAAVNEDASLVFSGGNLISINDPDHSGNTLTVSLDVDHGTLALSGTTGLTLTDGDGSDGTLVFSGTQAAINAALNGLVYTPHGDFHGADALAISVDDGGNTGPVSEGDSHTVNLTVTPVNDSPVASGGPETVSVTVEDQAGSADTLSALLAGNYSDSTDDQTGIADGGDASTALSFVAIVGSTNYDASQGTWQVSDGVGGWIDIPVSGLSTSSALVVDVSRAIRFNPAADFHGTPGTLQVRLADGDGIDAITASTGAGDLKDLSSEGGTGTTGRWSAGTVTLQTEVAPVNDRPEAADGVLGAIDEANLNPVGDTLENLFGTGYDDSRDDQTGIAGGGDSSTAFGAVAITGNAATAAQGTWQYSVDGGSSWTDIATNVADDNALILANTSDTRLRFVPVDGDYNGAPGSLSVRLADSAQTSAVGQDISADLGATDTWSQTQTLSTQVNPVNDQPGLTGTAENPTATEQGVETDSGSSTNEVQLISSATVSDVDLADNGGIGFSGASITVAFTDGYQAGDRLFVSGSPTGIDSISGGTGNSLTINLAAGVSTAQVEAIIEAIRFRHDGDDPTAGGTDLTRDYSVTFNDGGTRGTPGPLVSPALTGTITLVPVNDAPAITAPATRTVAEDGALGFTGGVISVNDPDLAGNPVEVTLTVAEGSLSLSVTAGLTLSDGDGSDGTLVFSGTQADVNAALESLSYSPNADFNGSDSLLITTNDMGATGGPARGDSHTVTLTVTPVADGVADSFVTDEDTALNANVSINDTHGASRSYGLNTNASHGDVVLLSDGSFTYTPDADYNGSDSFTYDVTDVNGDTETVTVNLTVNPLDDAQADGFATDEDTQLNADVSTNDNFSAAATYSLDDDASHGSVSLNGDGTFTYTPDGDYHGSDSFSYTVTDINGDTETVAVALTVNPVNDAPQGADNTITLDEDNSHTFSAVDFGFTDPDDSPANSFSSVIISTLPGAGSLTYNGLAVTAGDEIAVADLGNLVFTPAADANGTGYASFTFQVRDDGGTANGGINLDATANTITFDVTAQNDAPTTTGLADQTSDDGETVSLDAAAAFDDIDGDTLTYVATGLPSGLSIDANTGEISGTIAANASVTGSYSVTVTASDGNGGSQDATFTWTVNNVAPVAVDDTDSTDEESAISRNAANGVIDSNDQDGTPDNDNLSVTQVGNGSTTVSAGAAIAGSNGGQFTIDSDGSWSFDPNGDFEDLAAGATRQTTVTYTLSDGQGGTDTATLTVTVSGTNDAPTVTPGTQNQTLVEAGGTANGTPGTDTASIGLTLDDVDGTASIDEVYLAQNGWSSSDGGQTYSKTGTYGTATITIATGVVSYSLDDSDTDTDALDSGDNATDNFGIRVRDNDGATVLTTAAFAISGSDDNPVVTGTFAGSVDEGDVGDPAETATGTIAISDVDGDDSPVFSDVAATVGDNGYGSFDLVNGTWTYTLDQSAVQHLDTGDTATDTITFTASDGTTQQISVTITGSNDAPTVVASDSAGFTEAADASAQDLSDSGTVTFDDMDSDDLVDITYSVASPATWSGGTIDPALASALATGFSTGVTDSPAPGSVAWNYSVSDLDLDFLGEGETITFSYTITATDSHGATASDTVSFTITGTNDGPALAPVTAGSIAENNQSPLTTDANLTGTLAGSDVDNGDTLIYGIAGGSDNGDGTVSMVGTYGTLTVNTTTGAYSYSKNAAAIEALNSGETPNDSFTVTVTDSQGAVANQGFDVNITGANDAPVAVDDTNTTDEDSTLSIGAGSGVLVNDTDIDNSGTHTVSAVNGEAGDVGQAVAGSNGGAFTINSDGSYDFDPDGDFDDLDDGQSRTTSVTYTNSDGSGGSDLAVLTITVTGTNDAPVISVEGGDSATGSLTETDSG
ncbi:MAG: hypothetical protein CMK32_05685, partial [Porticoccaceae bacterium]|nr:hypothetical protein [Porticoccaceae bacterium]